MVICRQPQEAAIADAPRYSLIARHYEACLAEHGDTAKGVDWPDPHEARLRYDVMLSMLPPPGATRPSLLDLGCGAGHMLAHMQEVGSWAHVAYHGADLSPVFIELCRTKFPGLPFVATDAIASPESLPMVDYTVLNGVFTVKRELEFEEMWGFVRQLLRAAWSRTRTALAFNVMSTQVDWERTDLFHMPMDLLGAFLKSELSRHFHIRHDYGLYEYTCFVYRAPRR